MCHIRILLSKAFDSRAIRRAKDEQRTIHRITERARQEQLAALARGLGPAQVRLPQRSTPFNVVVNHLVHQGEIWQWSSLVWRQGVTAHAVRQARKYRIVSGNASAGGNCTSAPST